MVFSQVFRGAHYYRVDFESDSEIVESVKEIPGRKWNADKRFWGVPARSETDLFDFASKWKFRLKFEEGNDYANNPHLAVRK